MAGKPLLSVVSGSPPLSWFGLYAIKSDSLSRTGSVQHSTTPYPTVCEKTGNVPSQEESVNEGKDPTEISILVR